MNNEELNFDKKDAIAIIIAVFQVLAPYVAIVMLGIGIVMFLFSIV